MRKINFITESISLFNWKFLIKREIDIKKINKIIYSLKSKQIVLIVENEFDYNISYKNRDNFIIDIFTSRKEKGLEFIGFLFEKQFELFEYTLHNSERKKGIIKTI